MHAMGASLVGFTPRCDLAFLVQGERCSLEEIFSGKHGGRAQTEPKGTHDIDEQGEQRGEQLQQGVAWG
jgi:hypothetical protein